MGRRRAERAGRGSERGGGRERRGGDEGGDGFPVGPDRRARRRRDDGRGRAGNGVSGPVRARGGAGGGRDEDDRGGGGGGAPLARGAPIARREVGGARVR